MFIETQYPFKPSPIFVQRLFRTHRSRARYKGGLQSPQYVQSIMPKKPKDIQVPTLKRRPKLVGRYKHEVSLFSISSNWGDAPRCTAALTSVKSSQHRRFISPMAISQCFSCRHFRSRERQQQARKRNEKRACVFVVLQVAFNSNHTNCSFLCRR